MEIDYPKTRMDNFFAKAAGSELADDSMEPITDREYWINEMAAKIAQGSGGGGSGSFELLHFYWDGTYYLLDASLNDLIEIVRAGKVPAYYWTEYDSPGEYFVSRLYILSNIYWSSDIEIYFGDTVDGSDNNYSHYYKPETPDEKPMRQLH